MLINTGMIRRAATGGSYYGVAWDESGDSYVRTGDLAGVACGSSPGNALLPIHASMHRCILNDAGIVQYYLDATDSTLKENGDPAVLDGTDGQVMVQIPAFYYKHSYVGTTHIWEISQKPRTGFSLHHAFIKNGTNVAFRYIGAYEGSMWDASAAGGAGAMVPSANIIDNMYASGDKLCSISGTFPKVNETRAEFRGMTASRGSGWRQQDYDLASAVQLLYLVEYADFDSQSMIGAGRTQLSGSSWIADGYIGECGKSNADGDTSNSVAGNDNAAYMTYRGVENFFGNIWKWVDGINIGGAAGADDHKVHVCNNDSNFADNTWANYTDLGIVIPDANGFQVTLEQIDRGFLPASLVGGSSSTYICDYYYQNTGWRVVRLGGFANYGVFAGAFDISAGSAASVNDVYFGGRLAY